MAKEDLIPINKRSPEEQQAIRKKATEARKRKQEQRKLMKEQLDTLLSLNVKNKDLKRQMKEMGFADEDCNNQLALLINVFNQSLKDSKDAIPAAIFVRDTNGQSPVQKQVTAQTDFEDFIKSIEGNEF